MESLLLACLAVLFLAINLPCMFKFGVEKGRLLFFALIVMLVIGGAALGDKITQWINLLQVDFIKLIFIAVLLAVVVNAISIAYSIRIYKKREI